MAFYLGQMDFARAERQFQESDEEPQTPGSIQQGRRLTRISQVSAKSVMLSIQKPGYIGAQKFFFSTLSESRLHGWPILNRW